MESIRLFRPLRLEPDGAAIAMASRLVIDRRGGAEGTALALVEIAVRVGNAGADAQGAVHGIAKLLSGFEVVNADHDLTEHCVASVGCPVGRKEDS